MVLNYMYVIRYNVKRNEADYDFKKIVTYDNCMIWWLKVSVRMYVTGYNVCMWLAMIYSRMKQIMILKDVYCLTPSWPINSVLQRFKCFRAWHDCYIHVVAKDTTTFHIVCDWLWYESGMKRLLVVKIPVGFENHHIHLFAWDTKQPFIQMMRLIL